jgi:hypothetical protein
MDNAFASKPATAEQTNELPAAVRLPFAQDANIFALEEKPLVRLGGPDAGDTAFVGAG